MCEAWDQSFAQFLADMGECPDGLTIERIDVNKGYEPGNCVWATKADQAKNKTTTVWVEHNGSRYCLKDFAAIMGVNYKTLHARVRYHGMSPHDAV